ncbi:MAG: hypothetical protein Q8S00_17490 [Deltaproteobacteria bacterium]|nr:hypothetical protein [Deltaproteobacteria bacterium]MDZ4344158.1 hypothetical protein [Candidatus Binatia bacterium]
MRNTSPDTLLLKRADVVAATVGAFTLTSGGLQGEEAAQVVVKALDDFG